MISIDSALCFEVELCTSDQTCKGPPFTFPSPVFMESMGSFIQLEVKWSRSVVSDSLWPHGL